MGVYQDGFACLWKKHFKFPMWNIYFPERNSYWSWTWFKVLLWGTPEIAAHLYLQITQQYFMGNCQVTISYILLLATEAPPTPRRPPVIYNIRSHWLAPQGCLRHQFFAITQLLIVHGSSELCPSDWVSPFSSVTRLEHSHLISTPPIIKLWGPISGLPRSIQHLWLYLS